MIGTIALALAKYIPDAIGLFSSKRGKDANSAIEAVGRVAEALTGKSGDEAVKAIESDPVLALKFKEAVMADSHVSEQLEAEDRKGAREAYKVHHGQADKIAERIMRWNLPSIVLMAITQIAVVIIAKKYILDVTIVAIVSNILGLVINSLISERQAVVGFFFGSSMGSKNKDK